MDLLGRISGELQSRFTYNEITAYLGAVDFERPKHPYDGQNSKRLFSAHLLQLAQPQVLAEIAADLGIEVPRQAKIVPPANWRNGSAFRLFISHISKDKDKATRLKDCLVPYAIAGFVAHEDIYATLEWQQEIERALNTMHAFLAIHTVGFSQSVWTQQEIGFAVGRGVKIISLKMGEDPTGFISKHQALPRLRRSAEEIAKEIDSILTADSLTATNLLNAKKACGFVGATDEIPFE